MLKWRDAVRAGCCALVLLGSAREIVEGQDDVLPERRLFRSLLADPMAPRISTALMRTNVLATQGPERPPFHLPDAQNAATEVVAAVGIGAVFPLVELARWRGGAAQLVADGRVFARFRIEYPTRDDMGQDWWVGGAVEWAHQALSGRVGIMHRSSHLGDEFMLATGARRIEFGGEQLDVLTAWDAPGIGRVYGGGSWVFRSYLGWEPLLDELNVNDRGILQAGADREWRPWASDRRFVVHAGVDIHAADRTNWRPGYAAAVGGGIHTGRALRLTLRGYSGPSLMGEFFRTPERFLSLELAAEF
jgi:hypothetical protein